MPEPSPNNFARIIRPYALLIAVVIMVIWKFGDRIKQSYFPEATTTVSSSSQIRRIGNFEVLDNCQWIDDKGNDGDSFKVKHGGTEYTIRLYYVDTPEKYLSEQHKSQRERVADQGGYFGGLSPDQTVEIGLKAKAFTEKQLKGNQFSVLTEWENVYNSDRYYGIVWLPGSTEENPLRLSEELVQNGLARIHTKGPNSQNAAGFSQFNEPDQQRQNQKIYAERLKKVECQAKQARTGAWGAK